MTDAPQVTAPPAPTARRPGRARISGVDLARALAILGMLAVHIGPTGVDGPAGRLYAAPHGRASILFVLVAGVGVSLLAGSRSRSPGGARARLLWRAALLLPAGLALQELDHGVYVILQDYALLFALAAVVLGLPDRWLLGAAAAVAAFGPLAYLWGEINAPDRFARDAVTLSDPLPEIVHGLLLSGPYPLITWSAPFLFGVWLGRRDLRARAVRVGLLTGGAAVTLLALAASAGLVAVVGEPVGLADWDLLVTDNAHSQMPLWLIGATGSAAFLLGLSLIVADTAGPPVRPLVAVGQLALTVYVGHLLALHVAPDALTADDVAGAVWRVVAFALVAGVFAFAWRRRFERGPLEAVLQSPWQVARALGQARGS